MVDYFLILILAHLLTDFVFQSETLTEDKQDTHVQKRNKALFIHSLTFLATSLILFVTIKGITWWPSFTFKPISWVLLLLLWLIVITVTHYYIDLVKVKIQIKLKELGNHKWDIFLFLLDQIIHFGIISLMVFFFHKAEVLRNLSLLIEFLNADLILSFKPTHGQLVLILLCIGILVTSFSNIFIKISLTSIKMKIIEDKEEVKIGRFIGGAERLLTAAGVIAGAYEAIAALYAAKTAIRFKQASNPKFAEYFILGTSISALFGILTGLVLKILIG
ncbi:MAG: DUF3307 domain-containing protein [Clostridia bacterium]|nr:DUF3307 domain-containing protein [Clostridia bacterium]